MQQLIKVTVHTSTPTSPPCLTAGTAVLLSSRSFRPHLASGQQLAHAPPTTTRRPPDSHARHLAAHAGQSSRSTTPPSIHSRAPTCCHNATPSFAQQTPTTTRHGATNELPPRLGPAHAFVRPTHACHACPNKRLHNTQHNPKNPSINTRRGVSRRGDGLTHPLKPKPSEQS